MANIEVKTVKFETDNTELQYIEEEGTGAPLFSVPSLAKALGIKRNHRIWSAPKISRYLTHRTVPNSTVPVRHICKEGVTQLLFWKHPNWEPDFYKTFEIVGVSGVSTGVSTVITPDNLELEEKKERIRKSMVDEMKNIIHRQDSMEGKLDKLIELVDGPSRAPLYRPLYIPVYGTDKLVSIPSQAEHLFINMCNSRKWKSTPRKLNGAPLYTHVEGYRTYKEMLAAAGMDILINTRRGRDLSRQMAWLASKHGVKYYLVVDSVRYHQQHQKNQRRRVHMGTYSINAYPKELWEVIEPVALKYLDEEASSW